MSLLNVLGAYILITCYITFRGDDKLLVRVGIRALPGLNNGRLVGLHVKALVV
jgi:hypothetical protein